MVKGQDERWALRNEMMRRLDSSGIKGTSARELQSGKSSKGGSYSSKGSKAVSADLLLASMELFCFKRFLILSFLHTV